MNIIQLDKYGKSEKKPALTEAGRLFLLKESRNKALTTLTALLAGMMDKVDDVLFEWAEKAESHTVQSTYFDAMREVRLKRQAIQQGFRENLGARFDNEVNGSRRPPEDDLEDSELSLALMDADELEESLAITNMAAKGDSNFKEELGVLAKRMGVLLNDPELTRSANPVRPEVICNAFADACQAIGSGVKVRLIILKLFDRYVIDELPLLYDELNDFLLENGVLPKIRVKMKKRSGSKVGNVQGPSDGEPVDSDETDVFQSLQQLLASSTGRAMPVGNGLGAAAGRVLGVLTVLQQGGGSDVLDNNGDLAEILSSVGSTNVLRHLKTTEVGQSFAAADDMTIDIVAMLFDYILDDKDLPDSMKALIGRLQIPVLKVVMLDRTFFARKSHPARRLVNLLAEAATGWTPEVDDRLHAKVSALVQRVVDEFEDDVEIFAELLEDFEQFLAEETRLAEEKALQSTEAMEKKERVVVAKAIAQQEVERRAEAEQLRDVVRGFLTTHWNNLLFLHCAKEGVDSDAYRQAVETMDDLIWSVAPKQTAADRKRLVRLLPKLLMRLKEGMTRVSVEQADCDRFLTVLADYHAWAVNGGVYKEQVSIVSPVQNADPVPEELEHSGSETAAPVDQVAVEDDAEAIAAEDDATRVTAIRELLEENGVEVNEIALSDGTGTDTSEPDDEYLEQAQNLAIGSWVEFLQEDGTTSRARLTWISRVTGTYLFTNRKGLKDRDMTMHGLAAEFRSGGATPLEEIPLLDRAVDNLMDGLRKTAVG